MSVKIQVYNQEGKATGTLELNDAVFGVKAKNSVVHQVYLALCANTREPWAHTKGRGEVRGGGRKPWKQKGTGRARHGSIRSPIWRGGGITFGPTNLRMYRQKINQKMKNLAVRMALSDRVFDNKFVAVDQLHNDGKTKALASLRAALPGAGKTTLIVTAQKDEALLHAAQNISKLDVVRAADMNLVDLLHHQYIIADTAAVKSIEERLG